MKVAIIGAGLAGLTTAYELNKLNPSLQIDVLEASERIGGKLYTVPFDSGPTDMGAEAYLAFRTDATEFFKELGLEVHMRAPSGLPSMLYSGATLQELPENTVMGIPESSKGLEKLLSPESLAKIDAEGQQPGIHWTSQDVSLGKLLRERYGDEVVDRVVSALQGGVYSSLSDDLGVRATLPQLAATFDEMAAAGEKVTVSGAVKRMNARKSAATPGYKPQVFCAFRGGYAVAYEALAEQSQATIHLDAFVSTVTQNGKRFVVRGYGEFDRVVLATPAPTTAHLLRKFSPIASQELSTIDLASSIVVGLKFDTEGLPDYSGILVAADEPDITAKAFTLSSKKWPHLWARGGSLVRASFGRYGDDSLRFADEDTLVDLALDDLQTITGFDGRAAGLSEIFVQRWYGGIPVYDPQHLSKVERIAQEMDKYPGIELTGAWRAGVGVPAVIQHARQTAAKIAQSI